MTRSEKTRPLYCAVDRQPFGESGNRAYYSLTVNRHDSQVVMLVFCLTHFDEYEAMRAVISREGWV